ncbi:MAG: biopolymer transporter ExbD [Phycisphaerales bacterium]|nr:biopolymer transporter ExbD [Phycisphaerales bacterium]
MMRRLRRSVDEVRVELTPMIDVVFLLLTFFVFSIVMMVRADVMNVDLPELASGVPAEQTAPIMISIGDDGGLFVNREETDMDSVVGLVEEMRVEFPDAPIVLAVDVGSSSGVLIELADRLTGAGLGAFSILGQEGGGGERGGE